MILAEFENWIGELSAYFAIKQPSRDSITVWYKDCQSISGLAMPFIIKVLKELESFPRNLPKRIWEAFQEYRRQNPEKEQDHKKTVCRDCKSSGFIYYIKPDEPQYKFICRCKSCNNWRRDVTEKSLPESMSNFELEAKGLKLIWPVINAN